MFLLSCVVLDLSFIFGKEFLKIIQQIMYWSICISVIPITTVIIMIIITIVVIIIIIIIIIVNMIIIIIIVIIIIIIINGLITLLSIYLLGNLHLSQTVGGIRFSQGKEIHPIH
jgi:hypothetical protein